MELAQGLHLCSGISDQSAGSSSLLHMQSSLVICREKMTFSRVWRCKESCVTNTLPFGLHVSFQFLLFFKDPLSIPFPHAGFSSSEVQKSKTAKQKGRGRSGIFRGLLPLNCSDVMCGWVMCCTAQLPWLVATPAASYTWWPTCFLWPITVSETEILLRDRNIT